MRCYDTIVGDSKTESQVSNSHLVEIFLVRRWKREQRTRQAHRAWWWWRTGNRYVSCSSAICDRQTQSKANASATKKAREGAAVGLEIKHKLRQTYSIRFTSRSLEGHFFPVDFLTIENGWNAVRFIKNYWWARQTLASAVFSFPSKSPITPSYDSVR